MRTYTVILTPDTGVGGYTVRVPALPGCNTQGDRLEEALANARKAIELYLEDLRAGGEPIPEDIPQQAVRIEVAASRACGPGSMTVGLARVVAPGLAPGVDRLPCLVERGWPLVR